MQLANKKHIRIRNNGVYGSFDTEPKLGKEQHHWLNGRLTVH